MKTTMIVICACGALLAAAAVAKPGKSDQTSLAPKRCALRLRQCVVFWKEGGKEFMGSGTLDCAEAEKYVARRNEEAGAGSHWFRTIDINTDIDLEKVCASQEEIERSKRGTPWQDAIPATKKQETPDKK